MEDPQPSLLAHHMETNQPTYTKREIPSVSASPEHSRARSKRSRAIEHPAHSECRPQIRRRESYTDGNRRGRSRTRSVSPQSNKRTMRRRRRRSRSPSRSCSTSDTEMQSSNVKRQRRGHSDQAMDEHAEQDASATTDRDESRESVRSRSKRRKRYRRRSDYAAAAADSARDVDLPVLRSVSSVGGSTQKGDMPQEGRLYAKTESYESVLEEDEDADGTAQER
jgi:hypothetical protein